MKPKDTPLIPPTADEIPALVDRAATLEREIAVRKAELDTIKKRLELVALTQRGESLKNDSREGVRSTIQGTRSRAEVVVSADALITSFRDKDDKHKELLGILGDDAETLLPLFFEAPNKWINRFRDGLKFREAALEHLGQDAAPRFITACKATKKGLPKNTVTFRFTGGEGHE